MTSMGLKRKTDLALGLVRHAVFARPGEGAAMRCDLPGYLVVLKLFTLLHTGVCGIGVPAFSSPDSSSAAYVKSATWGRRYGRGGAA
jgi:hypothetical protein